MPGTRKRAREMAETFVARRSEKMFMSVNLKKLLVYHCCHLDSNPEFVMINLFGTSDHPPSLQYLEKLWRKLKEISPEDRNIYVGYQPTISKKLKMIQSGSQKERFLEQLLSENRSILLKTLTQAFHERFYQ